MTDPTGREIPDAYNRSNLVNEVARSRHDMRMTVLFMLASRADYPMWTHIGRIAAIMLGRPDKLAERLPGDSGLGRSPQKLIGMIGTAHSLSPSALERLWYDYDEYNRLIDDDPNAENLPLEWDEALNDTIRLSLMPSRRVTEVAGRVPLQRVRPPTIDLDHISVDDELDAIRFD
jgi:hypothetical protein